MTTTGGSPPCSATTSQPRISPFTSNPRFSRKRLTGGKVMFPRQPAPVYAVIRRKAHGVNEPSASRNEECAHSSMLQGRRKRRLSNGPVSRLCLSIGIA
jgi:hypothetical protein